MLTGWIVSRVFPQFPGDFRSEKETCNQYLCGFALTAFKTGGRLIWYEIVDECHVMSKRLSWWQCMTLMYWMTLGFTNLWHLFANRWSQKPSRQYLITNRFRGNWGANLQILMWICQWSTAHKYYNDLQYIHYIYIYMHIYSCVYVRIHTRPYIQTYFVR